MKKAIFAAVVLALAVLTIWFFTKKPAKPDNQAATTVQNQEQPAPEPKPQLAAAVNGSLVAPEVAAKRPIAVMVENHPDARPQSGLTGADLVYEALAEGGITRFMAVYQTGDVKNIGPVRSARTYFAEIADELGAIYAHVGGNSDVLANIKQKLYKNIGNADQFFDDGSYFHRISARPMPHNVYTSTAKLQNLIGAYRFGDLAAYQNWQFNYEAVSPTSTASNITIDFSLSQFLVNYRYDSKNNQYLRFLAGKPHTDLDTGKQIVAKDVIVQFVQTFPVKSDTPLSIGMTLTGTGKAYVFQDGGVIIGTWKKTAGDRTRYFDANGREIKFNPGQVWVELVPTDRTVMWK